MAPVCQEAGIPVPVACVSTCPAVIQAAPLAENKFAPVVFNHNSLAGPSAAQGCGSCVPLRIEGVRSSQGPTNSYVPPPVAPSSSSYVPPIQAPASGSFVPLPVAQPPVIAASAALGQQPGGLPQAHGRASVFCPPSAAGAVLAGALPQAMPAQVVQASSGLQQAVPQVAGGFAPQGVATASPVLHQSRAPSPAPYSGGRMQMPQHSGVPARVASFAAGAAGPTSMQQPAWAMSQLGKPIVASVGSSLVASPVGNCRSITPHRLQVPRDAGATREPFGCLTNRGVATSETRTPRVIAKLPGRENTAPLDAAAPPPPWLLMKGVARGPGPLPLKSPVLAGAGCGGTAPAQVQRVSAALGAAPVTAAAATGLAA